MQRHICHLHLILTTYPHLGHLAQSLISEPHMGQIGSPTGFINSDNLDCLALITKKRINAATVMVMIKATPTMFIPVSNGN